MLANANGDFTGIIVGTIAIVLFGGIFWFHLRYYGPGMRRHRIVLDYWADKHGLRLLQAERHDRPWKRGPFTFYRSGSNQSVYRISVADRDDREFAGWARVGGLSLAEYVKVVWDDDGPDVPELDDIKLPFFLLPLSRPTRRG